MTDVPLDEAGRPLCEISIYLKEKVPTVQYGNLEFSTGIRRFCVDTPEGRRAGMDGATAEIKSHMAVERAIVYELRSKLAEG